MNPGELLIIGGAEEKCPSGEILNEFVTLASQKGGKIGLLPAASEIPEEVSKDYIKTFGSMHAGSIEILDVQTREDADSLRLCSQLEEMGAVFISGGDQSRLAKLIKGTRLHSALLKKWRQGLILGGTSAGASIMGRYMITSSRTLLTDERLEVEEGEGFGFLETVMIDQHFSQRGRFDRLLSAIAKNTELIGIGIDENTAILVMGSQFKVLGEHQVLVMDGKSASLAVVGESSDGSELITTAGFILHTLTKGYGYHLSDRKFLTKGMQS